MTPVNQAIHFVLSEVFLERHCMVVSALRNTANRPPDTISRLNHDELRFTSARSASSGVERWKSATLKPRVSEASTATSRTVLLSSGTSLFGVHNQICTTWSVRNAPTAICVSSVKKTRDQSRSCIAEGFRNELASAG